jgi:hypothetical protein
MWLPWQYALWLAVAAAVVTLALYVRTPPRQWLWVRLLTGESAIFATLYTVWQGVGHLPDSNDTVGATARATAIVDLERVLHLPTEQWTQQLALHSHLVVTFANWYYIIGHTPVLGVFLVWLYVRHRARFARWRTVLAIGCIVGELIQIIPVAPPRLALRGIIDTGRVYGPTVYESSGAGFAPQLAAMPSLHCVWAITVGVAVFVVASGPWRWLGPVHAVVTVLVVVITGNHYWMDAVAAAGLVVVGLLVHNACAFAWRGLTRTPPAGGGRPPARGRAGRPRAGGPAGPPGPPRPGDSAEGHDEVTVRGEGPVQGAAV